MTTITVIFTGEYDVLRDAAVSVTHFASQIRIEGGRLIAKYLCETDDDEAATTQVMDSVDLATAEVLGVELHSVG